MQHMLCTTTNGGHIRPRNGPQKSLTEAKLVGVDDSLGYMYILWACYFMLMQEQGYDMDPSLI